jgi:NCS1 family nucleobase:cation symporter-1
LSAYDIRRVGEKERKLGFLELFSIWFGAGISIAEFWAGALLTPSLGLGEAFSAIIIGHAIGNLLLSIISLAGYYTGLPTMVLLRITFGKAGSCIASILNYIQLIGWTAIMLIVGAKAADTVSHTVYSASLYTVWILILGVLVTLWSIVGPRLWKPLEDASMILLLILSVWLVYVVIGRGVSLPNKTGGLTYWVGLDIVIAMPVSWAPLAADYSRFSRKSRGAFWGTFWGYFVSSSLFYFIGAFTNMAYGYMDPITLIAAVGLGIPAFLIIVFSTITTTFMDVYSAGISIKNVFERVDGKLVVLISGIAGTLLAIFFPIERYESFLLLIGGVFVPLSVILSLDYLFNKTFYLDNKKSRVYRENIFLWLLGSLIYLLFASESLVGVSVCGFSWIGNHIGSSLPTIAIILILQAILNFSHKNQVSSANS